jgi:16S rRNA (guanine(966)-N(2))-methyltransferase RsmD
MRIIGGQVGGRRLVAPRGMHTRPTADKVRQSLFDLLCSRGPVPSRVLDLYAGSGALALEALSRGARAAVLVEEDPESLAVIERNAQALGLAAACQPVRSRVLQWLRRARTEGGSFGWVFLDPPYASAATGELDKALGLLATARLLAPGGLVIAEHELRRAPADAHEPLRLTDRRRYGATAVSLYAEEGDP